MNKKRTSVEVYLSTVFKYGLIILVSACMCATVMFNTEKLFGLYPTVSWLATIGLGIMDITFFVTAIITSHLIIALDLGSALKFYDKVSCWDLIAHGYFGFVASFLVLTVLLNFNGDKLKFVLLLGIILFIVIGFGGFWEIIEFICDRVLGGDSQRVQESIDLGHTPVWDTMMDLIVTIPGVLCFWLVMMIDQYSGGKLYNHLLSNSKKLVSVEEIQ